jgi:hypothetical protein
MRQQGWAHTCSSLNKLWGIMCMNSPKVGVHVMCKADQQNKGWAHTVRCAVRCATKIQLWNLRSRVSAWESLFPGPAWPHLAEGAPDSPVHTGQSGAPGPETLTLVFQLIFKSIFFLTCEWVLEWHLALYVSVIVHQHYTRTLLVKLTHRQPLFIVWLKENKRPN